MQTTLAPAQRGMTLKQMARAQFWKRLDEYREALRTGSNLAGASLNIHAALGRDGVPKSWRRYVTSAFRQGGETQQ